MLIEVDNTRSERLIEGIEVTLRQTVTYKTGNLDDPDKGKTISKIFDLKMLEFGDLDAGGNTGELVAKFDIEEIALQFWQTLCPPSRIHL